MAQRISLLDRSADRVLVVANPAATETCGEATRELIACLKDYGLSAEVVGDLATFEERVKRHHAAGRLRAVVAAGGDGTVAEIVNRTAANVPVSVYPLGTANLLARYFHLECDPVAMASTVLEGATARFDAATANGRIFLLMAGCGFDGDVVERMHRRRAGRRISYWAYARPIIEAIQHYRYPDLRITWQTPSADGTVETTHRARWAFVVNLPDYAGGLRLAPAAIGTDGLLDLCLFERGSLWHGLKYLGFVKLGRHGLLPDCKLVRATRVRIESDQSVPYQLDGDPGGLLPLEIEVLSGRVTILAPYSRLLALGVQPAAPAGAGVA